TSTESPLALLDLIQVFVESLDSLFNNVCELDLIFNFEAMHACLAEIVVGGVVVETRVKEIVKGVRDSDKGSVRGKEQKMGPVGAVGRGMWAGRALNAPTSSSGGTTYGLRNTDDFPGMRGEKDTYCLVAILCTAMAQAPPTMQHLFRRLGSFAIRKHAAFPTADQHLPSSIPESLVSYVTTGTKHDASSGFKRLARFSYVDHWRRNGKVPSQKPGFTPDSISRKALDLDVGRISGDGSRRKDNFEHLHNQGRPRMVEKIIHELSETKGPGLASTPRYEYNPERTRHQQAEKTFKSAANTSGARVGQDTSEVASQDQSEVASQDQIELPRNPAPGGLVRKVGITKSKKVETPRLRKLESLRLRNVMIGFSDQQVPAQAFSTSTRRLNASPAKPSAPEPISIDQYHRLADHYIDTLVSKLEELQEERRDVDCEYSAGVLNLEFPPAGTYVFNKQPPNKQIWLSSPISGPKRYDY
ncbi:MAG: hypothetical protein L6R42_010362, partial [Xanthoria sp. 1 TBL-2021]